MGKGKTSLRGKILHRLIDEVTSAHIIGEKIKSGEFVRHPVESTWRCPAGFRVDKIKGTQFEMELLEPIASKNGRVILQLHGGGYIGPMKNIYRDFAVLYSKVSGGSAVLSIDYRVAPQHPYPAALEDAFEAYQYLLQSGFQASEIVIAGDSAGGGLALALCLYLKDHGVALPKGILTMSAWTDLTCEGESYFTNYEIDVVFGNTRSSLLYNKSYVSGSHPQNPYISPVFGNFTGFPPMLMQVGDREMLLSDTITVAYKAKEQNVLVRLSIYPGMFHVFQFAKLLIPESKKAWEEIARFFRKLYPEQTYGNDKRKRKRIPRARRNRKRVVRNLIRFI